LVGAKPPVVARTLADPMQQLAEFPPVGFDGGSRPSRERLYVLIEQPAFWGCKPEPQKIPSLQIQPGQEG
jgi:hypothetical protein